MGDQLDESKATQIPTGGFVLMPAQTHHFAICKDEAILQIHAMGPFGINYINPSEDPRKK